MEKQRLNKTEQEIKSAIMDKIEDAVDDYLLSFRLKSNDGNGLPNINEIEDMMQDLKNKTRDIYLSMVSDSITKFDESKSIDSKKENTEKGA
ncbi:MAG: hypothetical protein IJ719_09110 [Clostridia bacterium]|nr:hypothetical protein [Clostridia bacterium]